MLIPNLRFKLKNGILIEQAVRAISAVLKFETRNGSCDANQCRLTMSVRVGRECEFLLCTFQYSFQFVFYEKM